ncbi:TPA: toll/interleukin-1 receptor domain-containing protein, partial [Mannheimia haemolytica]|nr:toll/interleukin-1 receptor domain-containing protein [Mannheimia haemolytica]
MANKVFLSYAHRDEKFKKDLEDHLSILKRDNIIDTWNDRDISAGSEWENEIQSNLNEADIILCLVSSAFLASDYCYCNEFTKSLERHKTGECRIIPIIVRPCDWKNTPIGKIQAIPEDGKPVSSHTDQDDAWMNVVSDIRRVIDELKKKNMTITDGNLVSEDFNDFLKDTTIPLNNDQGEVYFQDIYITPYLKCLEKDKYKKYDAESLLNPGKYILLGDEQCGKTSLLKYLFQEK